MGMIEDLVNILDDAGGPWGLTPEELAWIESHGGEVAVTDGGWYWVTEPTP